MLVYRHLHGREWLFDTPLLCNIHIVSVLTYHHPYNKRHWRRPCLPSSSNIHPCLQIADSRPQAADRRSRDLVSSVSVSSCWQLFSPQPSMQKKRAAQRAAFYVCTLYVYALCVRFMYVRFMCTLCLYTLCLYDLFVRLVCTLYALCLYA